MARDTRWDNPDEDPYQRALRQAQADQLGASAPENPYLGTPPAQDEYRPPATDAGGTFPDNPYVDPAPVQEPVYQPPSTTAPPSEPASSYRPPATDVGGLADNPYQSWLNNEQTLYDQVMSPPATVAPPATTVPTTSYRPPATDLGGTAADPYSAWLNNEQALNNQGTPPATTPPATTTPPAATQPDATGWNTGGFAAPKYIATDAPANTIGGWEQGNWSDPNMQTPKYVVGRILSKYPSTPAGLQQAMAEIQQAYPGATFDGFDYLTIPGVGGFDVIQAAGDDANSRWQWGLMADAQGQPAGWGLAALDVPTSAPAIPNLTGANAPTTGWDLNSLGQDLPDLTPTTAPTSTSTYPTEDIPLGRTTTEEDPFYRAQREKILGLLSQDPTAVTGESPGVKGSVDAYRAEAERARRERLRAEMEQLGAVGLEDSGAASSALAQGFEDMGTNVANYAATAVVNEMSARRAEVASALQMATQMGMTQEAQDLQRQLSNIDNAIRQQQFSDNLGWLMAQYQMNYPLIYAAILNGASPSL